MLKKLRSPLGCLLVSALLLMGGLVGLFVFALRHRGDPYIGEVLLADGVHRLRLLKTVEGPFDYVWKPQRRKLYTNQPSVQSASCTHPRFFFTFLIAARPLGE